MTADRDAPPLNLRITPAASIGGLLIDEDGDPIAGAIMEVDSSKSAPAHTDLAGRFRFASLPPGRYRIKALIPAGLRETRARVVRGVITGLPDAVYYQDAFDWSVATPIVLGAGENVNGIQFRIRRIRLSSLSGSVIDSMTGKSLQAGEVELESSDALMRGLGAGRTRLVHGSFNFDLLRPGSYHLLIYRASPKDEAPVLRNIDVPESGAHDLTFVLPPPSRLTGRANIPGVGDAITLELRLEGSMSRSVGAVVDSDGNFTFEGLTAGAWIIGLRQHFSGPAAKILTVARVRRGGRVLRNPKIEVAEGPNEPLEVELAEQFGVEGKIVGPDGASVPGASVLFHDKITGHWQFGRDDGSFRIGLIAGEYRVSAWPTGVPPSNSLTECANSQTVRVTGNTSRLTVKLCP